MSSINISKINEILRVNETISAKYTQKIIGSLTELFILFNRAC